MKKNVVATTKGDTDRKTWRRLKRITIVIFENLLALQFLNAEWL